MLTYAETSGLGHCSLLPTSATDPFDERLDGLYLYNKLQNKKIPIRRRCWISRLSSGIGNIYASEALFDAGIDPTRPAGNLSQKDCGRLVQSVRKILRQAIEAGGSSIHDYRKPDGSLGYFQNMHCVYNKTGQKMSRMHLQYCPNRRYKKDSTGRTSTFYCPVKQK